MAPTGHPASVSPHNNSRLSIEWLSAEVEVGSTTITLFTKQHDNMQDKRAADQEVVSDLSYSGQQTVEQEAKPLWSWESLAHILNGLVTETLLCFSSTEIVFLR